MTDTATKKEVISGYINAVYHTKIDGNWLAETLKRQAVVEELANYIIRETGRR